MSFTLTDDLTAVSEHIYELLLAAKDDLGLSAVYDGDQRLIGTTPVATVEAGSKVRELIGVPTQTRVDMTVYVMLYVGKITDTQQNYRDVLALAQLVEDLIHSDKDPVTQYALQGLLVFGMVTTIEPGFAQRGNTVYRTARLTFEGFSKVVGLPAG